MPTRPAVSTPQVHRVRVATGDEWRPLGRLLGAAFFDDPVWEWVAADPRRRRRHLGPAFGQFIRRRLGEGTVWTTDDLSGAAMWSAPDDWKSGPGEQLRMALPMVRAIGVAIRTQPTRGPGGDGTPPPE